MEIENTLIEGLKIIKPNMFLDERGYFFESYNDHRYKKMLKNESMIQDDHAFSKKNVLRGIHFQTSNPQEQLLYLAKGKIFYIAVDFRPKSKTFLQHISMEIDSQHHKQIFMPRGVGSGYYTISEEVHLLYKVSRLYGENVEDGIIWNDPSLSIEWPCDDPILSEKDKKNKLIKDVDFNKYPDLVEI